MESSRRSRLLGVVVLLMTCSAVVGGVAFFRAFRRAMAVDGYAEAQGQVTTSERKRRPRSTYLAFVARYEVGGRSYMVNSTFGAPDGLSDDEVVARFPVGSSVPVYYDPDDPADAVLTREVPYVKWLVLFVVTLVGAVALSISFLRRREPAT